MMVPGMKMEPVEILLFEDNPVDVMVTQEAFNGGRAANNLHVVEDGEEAMDFLYKPGKYSSAPSPEIILLDLNLPRKDGREVLAEIKGCPSCIFLSSFSPLQKIRMTFGAVTNSTPTASLPNPLIWNNSPRRWNASESFGSPW